MAEKIYTKIDIDTINRGKKAVEDQIYTDNKGRKYLGTSEGTLMFITKAESIPYTPSEASEIVSDLVEPALNELGEKVAGLDADVAEISDRVNKTKCKLVGIMIAT